MRTRALGRYDARWVVAPILLWAGCAGGLAVPLEERSRDVEAPFETVYEATILSIGEAGLNITYSDRSAGLINVGSWTEGLDGGVQVGATYRLEPIEEGSTRVIIDAPEANAGMKVGPEGGPLTQEQSIALHKQILENLARRAVRQPEEEDG